MIRRFAVTIIFIVCLYFTPMSISAAENRPQLLYNNGNYTGALFYLEQTLKSKPNDPQILTNIGSALLEAGNYSGAVSFYKRALAFSPHRIGALAGIGYASESLGNRSAALIYFKEAIVQPIPSDNTGLLERALAFSHLSNFSQALDIANHVLKGDPTNLYALNIKGVILLDLKNATGAQNESSFCCPPIISD